MVFLFGAWVLRLRGGGRWKKVYFFNGIRDLLGLFDFFLKEKWVGMDRV